jgi:hypothetical protein
VEEGRGDPVKTIKAVRCLLEKLGADVEDHKRKSPGFSQMAQNSNRLEAHAHSLKQLEGSIKWMQEALDTGYEMGIRKAQLNVLRSMGDFMVTFDRVAMAGQWKPKQKKAWKDQGTPMFRTKPGRLS